MEAICGDLCNRYHLSRTDPLYRPSELKHPIPLYSETDSLRSPFIGSLLTIDPLLFTGLARLKNEWQSRSHHTGDATFPTARSSEAEDIC